MSLRPVVRLTQHRANRLTAGPASEPIVLAAMREFLRDPPTEENDFIENCITEARAMFEAATGLACINQSWKMQLDHWPGGREPWWDGMREMPITELRTGGGPRHVIPPRYPLSSVTSIKTYDEADNETAVTVATVFFVDTESMPGRIALRPGQTWPIALRETNAVEINYIAGFGANAAAVPDTIKRAIKSLAGFLYENRGTGCSPQAALTGSGALQIAAEYVIVRI